MTSLTRQALGAVLLAELLCALAFSCATVLHERHVRLRTFDVMLEGRSDSLLGAVQDAEDPAANVTIDPREFSVPAPDVFAVYNADGRLIGASPHAPAQLIERAHQGFLERRLGRHKYRLLQRDALRIIDREETGGVGRDRPVTIIYGARTDHIWHEAFEAAGFTSLVSFTLLSTTTVLLFLRLKKILRPLNSLAVTAGGISTSSLAFEAPEEALHVRELEPLASALSAAMKRLREAFEAQHRFVGDATHELKTAVAVVRSSVQLLALKPRSQAEYQGGLERVLDDNSRVEELVSRMLLLARLEERAQSAAEIVNLAESVDSVASSLRSFAAANGVQLKTSAPSSVPVRLPRGSGDVLISNLVVNAVEHSSRGSAVHVGLQLKDGPHARAVLTVADTGSGISESALPHIFERFYREDWSRSRETGGAGLGLAICQAIVQAADGRISIESKPGSGTTVTVSFSAS